MNRTEAFERTMAYLNGRLSLFSKITASRLDGEGITAQLLGGRDKAVYLDKGRLRRLPLLFLAKSDSSRKALDALEQIVGELEKSLPEGFSMSETESAPSLVDKGERFALYEAQVTLYYYEKNAAE